ncbi:MAG: hypothetical protein WBA97_34305 [Actinophytocola sp.]|uniref:hypothetical protein n=1 Tax=Actinophytocola sp. TaxID=1872138 RepID=UPI003C76AC41
MTDRERAEQYLAIFIGLGEHWRTCAPVDGELTEQGIRIGDIELWPDVDGTWLMQDGDRTTRYRQAVKVMTDDRDA